MSEQSWLLNMDGIPFQTPFSAHCSFLMVEHYTLIRFPEESSSAMQFYPLPFSVYDIHKKVHTL